MVKILKLLIKIYRMAVSPFFAPSCRYSPTCSEYSSHALHEHGFFIGCFLTAKRVLRCNPWGKSGYDPVPMKKKKDI